MAAKKSKPVKAPKQDTLEDIGRRAMASIVEMTDALEHGGDDARTAIDEDPLSIQVRSGWTAIGEPLAADEFEILLGTGGPAVRIVGDLNGGEPTSARLETQDWGTPWTEYHTTSAEDAALMAYVGCFYFEGA